MDILGGNDAHPSLYLHIYHMFFLPRQFISFCFFTMESAIPSNLYFKVTGDSLLIQEFAYSLFIGLCSVSIKLIHCGAPRRDVLSDNMVL